MSKLTWLVPILLLGVVLVGCGGGDDETIDLPGGGEVNVGGDVPDDFPDELVYDGADVVSSTSGEFEGVEGTYVIWTTDDSAEDVKSFYEDALGQDPWDSSGSFESGGTSILSADNSDTGKTAVVSIGEADGETTISIGLGDDTSGSSGDSGDDDSSSDDEDTPTADEDSSSGDDDSSSGDEDSSSGDAELPDEVDLNDNYPADEIPLPDNARVTSSSAFSSDGNASVFTEIYVEGSVDEVADYYETTLTGAGYSESFRTETDGDVFLTYSKDTETFTGDSAIVNITPADIEGYVLVNITVSTVAAEEGQ